MIGTALGAFLALLLPAAAGSGLVSTLWPGSPRILRIGLGTGIGLGLAGAAWTLALTISGSAAWSLLASEGLLLMLAAALLIRPRRNGRQKPSGERPTGKSNGVEVAALVLASLFCIGSAAVLSDASPHGGYDATAIWNSKARIFYLHERPLAALPDLVFPDYPILTPAIITRGWQYSQTHTVAVPVFVALFFTTASVLVLVGGLRRIVPGSTAFLAGCLALGTPFFLESGASQYADIVMCFFITSSSVLLLTGRIRESGTTWLPLLAGICAGLAACTKNEGNLFVLAMVLAQSGLLLWNRRSESYGIQAQSAGTECSVCQHDPADRRLCSWRRTTPLFDLEGVCTGPGVLRKLVGEPTSLHAPLRCPPANREPQTARQRALAVSRDASCHHAVWILRRVSLYPIPAGLAHSEFLASLADTTLAHRACSLGSTGNADQPGFGGFGGQPPD
jgi:hypothetical protein